MEDQFEISEQEIKMKNFWGRVRYFLSAIGPAVIRILNAILYWTLKIIKAFVKGMFRMILGKEV